MVPLCDLRLQYAKLKPEIDAAIQSVCENAHYILGPRVREFEQQVAETVRTRHAVGLNSGTDALQLALRGLEIGPGDEVITTPFSFIATSEAIEMVGARPVFADIKPGTMNLDPEKVREVITPRTKAILPVHLFGQPCEMQALLEIAEEHNLYVVEDCAQAMGATYKGMPIGTIGDAGCYSFFPSKNLGCFGDGGMLVTNDDKVGERVEMLRRHGGRIKYHHSELGLNSRLDELQAAILQIKLPHLNQWNESRRERAAYYKRQLGAVSEVTLLEEHPEVSLRKDTQSVYHQFTILVEDRDRVREELSSAGIGCAVYYPVPLHLQETHAALGYQRGDFPNAEFAADRCLSLPMFPELTQEQQDEVIATLKAAVSTRVSIRIAA